MHFKPIHFMEVLFTIELNDKQHNSLWHHQAHLCGIIQSNND